MPTCATDTYFLLNPLLLANSDRPILMLSSSPVPVAVLLLCLATALSYAPSSPLTHHRTGFGVSHQHTSSLSYAPSDRPGFHPAGPADDHQRASSLPSSPAATRARTSLSSSPAAISPEAPLRVVLAGAGVGGLSFASSVANNPNFNVTILEKTSSFRRFGGPIQLASNAMQLMKEQIPNEYDQVQKLFTDTGDKENGIKDGVRDEWYAKFDLGTPAEAR